MNETKPIKKEKVGADGLSKKERRAQKVGEKSKGDEAAKVVVNGGEMGTKATKLPEAVKTDGGLLKKERRAMKVTAKVEDVAKPIDKVVECDAKPEIEGKTKAQLRAERRDLQEKQRLAKLAVKDSKEIKETKKPIVPKIEETTATDKPAKKIVKHWVKQRSHLLLKLIDSDHLFKTWQSNADSIHPAFVQLGAEYASKSITGANARCLAFLQALQRLIKDLVQLPKSELSRALDLQVSKNVAYLQQCRPFAVSMNNAFAYFKMKATASDEKINLVELIETYIKDQIIKAGETISENVRKKIGNGDIIATFGYSSIVSQSLLDAHKSGTRFHVIVFDGRPHSEGQQLLRKLRAVGIVCSYRHINDISTLMEHISKVIIGAHAVLANGNIMARAGTAMLSHTAKYFNKPVLVCCETYKFSERAELDSLSYNEIGNWKALLNTQVNLKSTPLKRLNKNSYMLMYDLMYDYACGETVTAVVTELGFLSPAAVPYLTLKQME